MPQFDANLRVYTLARLMYVTPPGWTDEVRGFVSTISPERDDWTIWPWSRDSAGRLVLKTGPVGFAQVYAVLDGLRELERSAAHLKRRRTLGGS